MKAVKGNKEYFIDESQKKGYQDRGYDIIGDDGSVSAYGRGKTVPYDEYEKAVRENNALKEQMEKLLDENQQTADGTKAKPSGKGKTKEDAAAD